MTIMYCLISHRGSNEQPADIQKVVAQLMKCARDSDSGRTARHNRIV